MFLCLRNLIFALMKRKDINERLNLLGQLIIKPKETWKNLSKSIMTPKELFRYYFFPALVIFFHAEMFGMLIDADAQLGPNWFIVLYAMVLSLGLFISFRLSVWGLSLTLKSFGYKEKSGELFQLLGLPLILGYIPIEITALFHSMFILILLSLYAFYIFWIGTQTVINMGKEKKQVFGILAIVFTAAIHVLIFFVIQALKRPIIDLF